MILCEYSTEWMTKFKRRHGIQQLHVCTKRAPADHEAVEQFVDNFNQLISKQNLTLDQIYNVEKTSLIWQYVPRKTLDEDTPKGIKDAKKRLMLACANAVNTHKCKLVIIGKSAKLQASKGIKMFPMHYRSNKRAGLHDKLQQVGFKITLCW